MHQLSFSLALEVNSGFGWNWSAMFEHQMRSQEEYSCNSA